MRPMMRIRVELTGELEAVLVAVPPESTVEMLRWQAGP